MSDLGLIDQIPKEKGSYLLILSLAAVVNISFKSIGDLTFPAGIYVYSGNAQGPGGLRGRVRHHLKVTQRYHWHIDYLRARCQLVGVISFPTPAPSECDLIAAIAQVAGSDWSWKRFGASDCRKGCLSHLVWMGDRLDFNILRQYLLERFTCNYSEGREKSPQIQVSFTPG